ncbi:MAG: type II secretion system minor pseudopilin GspI [Steroidobacteraceae bacterium]
MSRRRACGFTLVEVLVALMIVAMGLAALMVAVSGAARTSGYLRDKSLAQWIALNRLSEVRLNANKSAQNADTGELKFANRTWHYDTRYFDTSITSMKRIVVRVYAGDAKTKGNPLAESTSFFGTALGAPGGSNAVDWTQGSTAIPTANGTAGIGAAGAGTAVATGTSATGTAVTPTPQATPQ